MRLISFLLLSISALTRAQTPPEAFRPIVDTPGLPRVLLIGDSISIAYTLPVRELLKGKANIHRIPENAAATVRGVEQIDAWLGKGKWDVVHFNFGLHDLKFMFDEKRQVEPGDYERNLRRVVWRLKQTGAALIWASTTPVPNARQTPQRSNDDVLAYNAIARQVMEENQIAIDDLYAHAAPHLAEWQRPANVHFTDSGSDELAKAVAASVGAVLKSRQR